MLRKRLVSAVLMFLMLISSGVVGAFACGNLEYEYFSDVFYSLIDDCEEILKQEPNKYTDRFRAEAEEMIERARNYEGYSIEDNFEFSSYFTAEYVSMLEKRFSLVESFLSAEEYIADNRGSFTSESLEQTENFLDEVRYFLNTADIWFDNYIVPYSAYDVEKAISALEYANYTDDVIGNVDGDKAITIKDATAIQKYVSSLINFDETQLTFADTDGNKEVNVKDATAVQKYLADLLTETIIGKTLTELKPEPDPEPDPEPEKYAYIDIGGVRYKACVGDTISYVVELQADKLFENIQAVINYDSKKLELVRIFSDDPDVDNWEVEGPERCPYLDDVFFNGDLEDEIRFNASKVSGYNFRAEKTLVRLEFVVKDAGNSEITLDIEYMTIKGDGSQKYFYDGEPVITDGITIREEVGLFCGIPTVD